MTPYYHAGLSQPSLFFKKTLFMLSIFARPRPLNRSVLGCHMIVTRSYVRKLEFCNLIGAFTFQYAAILLDQEIRLSQVGGVWERDYAGARTLLISGEPTGPRKTPALLLSNLKRLTHSAVKNHGTFQGRLGLRNVHAVRPFHLHRMQRLLRRELTYRSYETS